MSCTVADNGRIRPDWVWVDGKEERHPEGAYCIDYTDDNAKRIRVSVGKAAKEAQAQRLRKEAELRALAQGLNIVSEDGAPKRAIALAAANFLEEIELTKEDKTHEGDEIALRYFQESCAKRNLEDIERVDLLKCTAFLKNEKKLSPRTVHNKFACVLTFLNAHGLPKLIEILREFRPKDAKGAALVFCTASGRPDTHMLRALKRNAVHSGQDQDRFWLHKFRATFATMHLAAGVDLRTVQAWLGHTNLESTIRCLKPARNEAVREKVNATFA